MSNAPERTGTRPEEATLEEMDALWEEGKAQEKAPGILRLFASSACIQTPGPTLSPRLGAFRRVTGRE